MSRAGERLQTLDLENFEKAWGDADESLQLQMVTEAAAVSPAKGIIPVLAGIASYHFAVRNRAKESLSILKARLEDSQAAIRYHGDREGVLAAIDESSVFNARIYNTLGTELPAQEIKFFMEVLLETGGRGPFYAWRFYQRGDVPLQTLNTIVSNLSEPAKLALADQYLKSSPSLRRRYANEFRRLFLSISQREAVLRFYAYLFDVKRNADPFLHHIPEPLRDPAILMDRELKHPDPLIRLDAIKMLAMLVPKIETRLLQQFLANRENAPIRRVVFKIAEASPMGAYPELENEFMEVMCDPGADDALDAFRALVMSKGFPLFKLLDTVRVRAPFLLNDIYEDLSSFSRISFFFIQELIINREFYLGTNRDIYKALIYGIIKKRPERLLNVFAAHEDHSDDNLRMDVSRFYQEIDAMLSREENDIDSEPAVILEQLGASRQKEKKPGFFKSVLSTSLEKRLKAFSQASAGESFDFRNQVIETTDLSGKTLPAWAMFHNCIIRDSDLSNTSFLKSTFKGALFYNVRLKGARFADINFDDAVFINVSADFSQFHACSFHGARFYTTGFDNAVITDSIFTGTVISCTFFKNANLSGCTFANSTVSKVSFAEAKLVHVDFAGVKARFSRFFPTYQEAIETENADYNARSFQMEAMELPDSLFNNADDEGSFLADIDVLIMTELINNGQAIFMRRNYFSLLTALDIFRPVQADLFELIPLLIHGNIHFPGFSPEKLDAPCGISGYCPPREIERVASRYLVIGNSDLKSKDFCYVEGLFTIGSTGSIAQTTDSDVDYWVCLRDADDDPGLKKRFSAKLTLLEAWAKELFKIEIHFFVVDIDKVRENDFGESSTESSGTAQGRILKEEFYRTMIHVAGKIPLWCTLPVSASYGYYNKIYSKICTRPSSCRFLDLGDIRTIPSEEYFGASIWQLFKWLKSPFKSVMKMALLEKFIDESGRCYLLCNRFKDEWMNSGFQYSLEKIDPYYTLLKGLVDYYQAIKNPDAARLVQLCFFLKAGISNQSELENSLFGFRQLFIRQCMAVWSWSPNMVFDVGSFKVWPYSNITKLSTTIEKYMIKTYKKVNHAMEKGFSRESMISPEDRTVLGRKMFVQFSKHPAKIGKALLVSRGDNHFQGLRLQYAAKHGADPLWDLINKRGKSSRDSEELIQRAGTIEAIGAWMVHNRLFTPSTIISLVPNKTAVSADDIKKLFNALFMFFIQDKPEISFEALMKKSELSAMFISLNLCAPRNVKKIHECTAIHENTWGEMFCTSITSSDGFKTMDEVVAELKVSLELQAFPEKTVYYFPRSLHWKDLS